MTPSYSEFLASKAPRADAFGIEPGPMPDHLFDYQADCVAFALRQGRSAMFLDTGLGKTRIQLEWCDQAASAANGVALILTPLAVARQIEREAVSLGYDARVIRDASDVKPGINICNYDRLALLDDIEFGAVALDESSILKNFTGKTTQSLIQRFAGTRFRLCATATPAPNDHMELGTHAEFLGVMPQIEMLMRWFINDTSTASQSWRLKKHGEADFWNWVSSWARCAETPSDLGYDGSRFILPTLSVIKHATMGEVKPAIGELFSTDVSATTLHQVKRDTIHARAEAAASIVTAEPSESWVIWCDTDYEADALAIALPGATEVRGSHSPDRKEQSLADFSDGRARVLITKPSVCGAGMNWQHAARILFVGRSFSYESWYQAVRRCWRFGQSRPVNVHLIVAEGEDQIGRVIDRKAADHARMKRAMAKAMNRSRVTAQVKIPYNPTYIGRIPSWLQSAV